MKGRNLIWILNSENNKIVKNTYNRFLTESFFLIYKNDLDQFVNGKNKEMESKDRCQNDSFFFRRKKSFHIWLDISLVIKFAVKVK